VVPIEEGKADNLDTRRMAGDLIPDITGAHQGERKHKGAHTISQIGEGRELAGNLRDRSIHCMCLSPRDDG
tara:strand:+ start:15472 stop:15684 length:213 start_codon:yes stop_codon:yes gene_type:complete